MILKISCFTYFIMLNVYWMTLLCSNFFPISIRNFWGSLLMDVVILVVTIILRRFSSVDPNLDFCWFKLVLSHTYFWDKLKLILYFYFTVHRYLSIIRYDEYIFCTISISKLYDHINNFKKKLRKIYRTNFIELHLCLISV